MSCPELENEHSKNLKADDAVMILNRKAVVSVNRQFWQFSTTREMSLLENRSPPLAPTKFMLSIERTALPVNV
jgi:hypothetical protein